MSLFRSYINDRSVVGFSTHEDLRSALMAVVNARIAAPNLSRSLYCSRATSTLVGAAGDTLIAATQTFPREQRSAILQWLGRFGPFLEDEREATEDDLYHFDRIDVTDEGLGEAARQRQRGHDGHSFSLTTGNRFSVELTPLPVIQGLLEEPIEVVEVPNDHDLDALIAIANDAVPEPTSWTDLMAYCRARFTEVLIGEHCDECLRPQPFSANVARRTIELLRVLNEISAERNEQGALSAKGEELKQTFFVGKKAWFTDEGADNKVDFAREMTFPDPVNLTGTIRCFWHGKIKTPQFRIHFDWPNPPAGQPIRVAYIGPKISKR